ncbi:MAG: tRNA nucleotidyltransferase (CCA-adding enzyme) [Halobacteriales archaeon]|jgi:tRNA nucleotidyltransferase (CCA-adding enzyme)
MSDEGFEAVVNAVRERVDPDPEERQRLQSAVDALVSNVQSAIQSLPVEADVVQVGSTARGTWIASDRDIDLFVRFPTDLSREALEQFGLQIGHDVLPEGHEEFAEHPYVTGAYDGFDVDLVPCYAVESGTAIASAVDRTPFHTQYLEDRLTPDLAGDARVLKQFLKGIGIYGSDLRTRGFSGYLTELLVLEYGGFKGVVEAAADWRPPVRLDPEGHGQAEFDDALVVIDPTDPKRNVAAVLSRTNVARLQHNARDLLADPRESVFDPDDPDPVSSREVREHINQRGTTPIAVRFDTPDLVDDQLYPQLRKSLSGVTDGLDRRGFDVIRSTTMAGDRAVLFLELAVAERPAIERHEGPPVHVREHAERFHQKYAEGEEYGPFVNGDRYVVERDRAVRTAREFLESDALFDVGLGAHVQTALQRDYEVLAGKDVATLAENFGAELAQYFEPTP